MSKALIETQTQSKLGRTAARKLAVLQHIEDLSVREMYIAIGGTNANTLIPWLVNPVFPTHPLR